MQPHEFGSMLMWLDRAVKLLEQIPWSVLVIVAAVLAVVPFGESHLLQKWRMLFSGTLRRPLDWFDLVMLPKLLSGEIRVGAAEKKVAEVV